MATARSRVYRVKYATGIFSSRKFNTPRKQLTKQDRKNLAAHLRIHRRASGRKGIQGIKISHAAYPTI